MNSKTPLTFFTVFLVIGYLLFSTCLADEIVIEGDLDVEKDAIFGGDAQFLGSVQVAPQGDLLSLDPASVNQGNAQRYLNPDNGLLVTVRCSKLDTSVPHAANAGVLQFGSERIDTHNAFTNGVFTAPYTAMYSFEGLVDLAGAATIQGYKNDVLDDEEVAVLTEAGVVAINTIVSLQLGETYEFRLNAAVTQTTTSTNLSIVSLNVWEQPVSFDSVAKTKRTVYLTREMYEQAVTGAGGTVDTDYATFDPEVSSMTRFEVKAIGGGTGGVNGSGSRIAGGDTTMLVNGDTFLADGGNGSRFNNGDRAAYRDQGGYLGYGVGGGSYDGVVGDSAFLHFFTFETEGPIQYMVGVGGVYVGHSYYVQSGADGLIEIIWYE